MSEFHSIKSFPNYSISKEGNVRNNLTKKIRKPVPLKNGYLTFILRKEGKSFCVYIHRLVAETFIPNPQNKKEVNHKDGDKTNNIVSNLEWATHSENQTHRYDVLKKSVTNEHFKGTGEKHHLSKQVCQISPDGFLIGTFGSIREASRETLVPKSTILKCRNNKTKYAGGYIWK